MVSAIIFATGDRESRASGTFCLALDSARSGLTLRPMFAIMGQVADESHRRQTHPECSVPTCISGSVFVLRMLSRNPRGNGVRH